MSKMIKCKTCGVDIAKSAKSCPGCGAKNKKPFYTRWWFILIAIFIIIGALGGNKDNNETTTASKNESTPVTTDKDESSSSVDASNDSKNTAEKDSVDSNAKTDSVPIEYRSALKKAQTYSDRMYMSKAGLYDQLTSEYGEKFPAEAAQYAIDNVKADWNKNALEKAKTYQTSMSMSKSAIYDQLISEYGEKFTEDEAQYAVSNLEE